MSELEHFEVIRKRFLMKSAGFIQEKTILKNQTLYWQGDHIKNVYIILSGDFELKILLSENWLNHLKDKYLTLSIVGKDKVLLFDDLINNNKTCSHTLVCWSDKGVLNSFPAADILMIVKKNRLI